MLEFKLQKQLFYREGYFKLALEASLPKFSITAVMGDSGVGKTSLLKMLAGLLKPDSGSIELNGVSWFSAKNKINLPPQKRSIGFLFQEYALFPNMSVRENLQFAIKNKEQGSAITELLEMIGMTGFENVKPTRLSGGQQQRVALARAIISKPDLLLLDEPLSALDQQMRLRLQQDLKLLLEKYPTTVLLVTHDVTEAARLATHVLQIDQGGQQGFGTLWQMLGQGQISSASIQAEVINCQKETKQVQVLCDGKLMSFSWQEQQTMPEIGDKIELSKLLN